MACAPSVDSGQPGCPSSLIRVFADNIKKAWVLSYPLSAHQRLWSDWADAQADLSLRWAHCHFVCFVMRRLIRRSTDRPITRLIFTVYTAMLKFLYIFNGLLYLTLTFTKSCSDVQNQALTICYKITCVDYNEFWDYQKLKSWDSVTVCMYTRWEHYVIRWKCFLTIFWQFLLRVNWYIYIFLCWMMASNYTFNQMFWL